MDQSWLGKLNGGKSREIMGLKTRKRRRGGLENTEKASEGKKHVRETRGEIRKGVKSEGRRGTGRRKGIKERKDDKKRIHLPSSFYINCITPAGKNYYLINKNVVT